MGGWVPTRITSGEQGPVVEWTDLTGLTPTDPFFWETVARAQREPYRLLFGRRTGIEALTEAGDGLPVAGLVLHVSRCGSTLVSRLLGQTPGTLVLSEAPAIDHVLRVLAPAGDARVAWLRAVVAALTAPWAPEHDRVVLKLDAWSTRELPLLRAAFPGVPVVFVAREPAEVVASQLRLRGVHAVPGVLDPALFGMAAGDPVTLVPEAYVGRVIGSILAAAAEHLRPSDLVVDHRELPDAVHPRVTAHLSIDVDEPTAARLAELGGQDPKQPQLLHDPRRERELEPITDAIRAAVAEHAAPAYAALRATETAAC